MFGLFRKKTPPKTLFPDDQKKSDMANAIAELLGIQLLILPPEHKRIENDDGHIYRKAGSCRGVRGPAQAVRPAETRRARQHHANCR